MLLAIAPNPTIDRILYVPHMTVGAVHRATAVRLTVGSKGLNATRAALTLGAEVLATAPMAGRAGRFLADMAGAEGLPADWFWLSSGETRTCLLINHDTGDTTVINEPGPTVSAKDWENFGEHVIRLAARARAVAFAGSLPPGPNPDALSELARSLVTPERAVYLDTSGAALAAALARPDGLCIKVNRAELAAGLELWLDDIPQTAEAGRMLLARGAALVVVTLGKEGALAIAPEGCWQVSVPPVEVVSTVGSGDSLLAGLVVARLAGQSVDRALALGVACGAANALTDFPGQFERAVAERLLEQATSKRV